MSGPKITLEIDDDVPMRPLFRAIFEQGLRITQVDGFKFRVHRSPENVVSLTQRRRDAQTDAQMRDGMKTLFKPVE